MFWYLFIILLEITVGINKANGYVRPVSLDDGSGSATHCIHGSFDDDDGCVCHKGYTSSTCDQIKAGYCFNGGTYSRSTKQCVCAEAFTGNNCENDCKTDPCQHGTCHKTHNVYKCRCFTGYSGPRCANASNHCLQNKCEHGTCVNSVSGYSCKCQTGYTGHHCETESSDTPKMTSFALRGKKIS
ncbi:notch homolog 2 N-terminal-like protein A [Mytilus trossulus]|uniref:notch homolog 2 N-terminal-like protein A n=1 Tax=Mytilus trossulus TaxID=6551 RepID=UPI0030067D28